MAILSSVILPVSIYTGRIFHPPYLDVYYPMVHGLRNVNAMQRINFTIKQTVDHLAKELKQPDVPTYIGITYEIKLNERYYLSLTLRATADFGGAHPMTVVKALSFDVRTGISYQLSDLFKKDSDYVKVLSESVEEALKIQDVFLFEPFKTIKPDQDFYLTDKALIIYFQLYEITAYAYGFPYAVIPYYTIMNIIPEDGVLSRLSEFI